MRHSLCLSIGPLMCLGCFVIVWWGCAAPIALVGNPAFDGVYEGNSIADPVNRQTDQPTSQHPLHRCARKPTLVRGVHSLSCLPWLLPA